MTLGDLEFKAEDFESLKRQGYDHDPALQYAAGIANRLLRERLEKAPKVYDHAVEGMWLTLVQPNTSHTARLVCVAEIK